MQFQSAIVPESENGSRLDKFFVSKLGLSRATIQRMVKTHNIHVNKKPSKASQKVKTGDQVSYRIPDAEDSTMKAEKIPLNVIFEDENILVINKPAGIVVHPDNTGHTTGTLVNAILAHCKNLSGIGGVRRPGVVHRLDKDTSGVLIIAKNDVTHHKLTQLFHDRQVKKTYIALVKGGLKSKKGRIEAPLSRDTVNRKRISVNKQGKNAITTFEVVASYPHVSLLKVNIETGRTHQIRVHLASIGHPVVGDQTYGDRLLNHEYRKKYGLERQFLHAERLEIDGKVFEAPLPEDLLKIEL